MSSINLIAVAPCALRPNRYSWFFYFLAGLALLGILLVPRISQAEDVIGTIAMDGAATTYATTIAGQNIVLTFDASAGQRISLNVPGRPPVRIVKIFKPDGAILASSNGYWGQCFDALTIPISGQYKIVADMTGDAVGSVTFHLYGRQQTRSLVRRVGALAPLRSMRATEGW
jgi:hypothetical protein